MKPATHYKTDKVFHNYFLEILEDCIVESKLNRKEKDEMINILYHNFYDILKERKQTIKPSFKPRYLQGW